MHEMIQTSLKQYDKEIQTCFIEIRELLYHSVRESNMIEEKLWAKLPSYYAGGKFVRIIPFRDHINIEASAVLVYQSQLEGYKVTPKGMLQIYAGQKIPDVLEEIFRETLLG